MSTSGNMESAPAQRAWPVRAALFVLNLAVVRIVIAILLVGLAATGAQEGLRFMRLGADDPLTWSSVTLHLLGALLMMAAPLGVYACFVRVSERRWPSEIGVASIATQLPAGLFAGALLSITVVGTLAGLGVYTVDSIEPRDQWAGILLRASVSALVVSVFEETLVRAIILRITQQRLGSLWAIAISALLFGLAHLGNQNATLLGAIGLALQAGVLLGAAYIITQRLWFAVGLHCAWNFMQQGVVGGAVSGSKVQAIIQSHPSGADWLSGGAFGIEGSVIATALCGIAGVGLLLLAAKRGKLIPRSWPARKASTPA
jgi:membrane protease YdiL (CAAX protease family)